jgi:hypothetical protein
MKNILSIACLVVSLVFNAEAANYCWDPTASSYAGASATTNPSSDTFCLYTNTLGPASTFTNTMWPTYAYASAAPTSCTAPNTCILGPTSPAAVTNLPTVSSCYTGTSLTASTLTTQAQLTCSSTSYFCKATFTTVASGVAASVTSGCSNVACTPSSTVLCSLVANTNQVLGCYTGYYYSTGTSTWTKSICAPVTQGAGQPAVSAALCKNAYSWSATNGYTILGSCETTCSPVTIALTGAVATTQGTTCSSTVFGNALFTTSHAATIAFNLLAMILSSIMGLFVHF